MDLALGPVGPGSCSFNPPAVSVVEVPHWVKRNPPLFFQRQHTLLPLPSPEKAGRLSGVSVLTMRLTDAGRSCHLWCLELCLKMYLFCSLNWMEKDKRKENGKH